MDEDGFDHNSAMFQHLHGPEAFKFLFSSVIYRIVFTTKSM